MYWLDLPIIPASRMATAFPKQSASGSLQKPVQRLAGGFIKILKQILRPLAFSATLSLPSKGCNLFSTMLCRKL
jgi:hypothetical protein